MTDRPILLKVSAGDDWRRLRQDYDRRLPA